MNNRICIYCNKSLVPIGNLRENGKYGIIDSLNRNFHLKCKKEHNNEYYNNDYIEGKINHYCKECNHILHDDFYDNVSDLCMICDCKLYNNNSELYKNHGNYEIKICA